MSDVFFEEESREIEKDKEIANGRNNLEVVAVPRKNTTGQNIMMILFALVCILASYGVWHFRSGFYNPKTTLYKEDLDTAHLKLIPEFDREKFINSLPSKN